MQTHQHATDRAVAANIIFNPLGQRILDHPEIDRIEHDHGIVLHAQGLGGIDPITLPAGGLSQPRYEKYRLTARVSKRLHQFEQATLRQREPFHIMAAKYSDGLNQIEFGSPDARFPTVQVKTTAQITNKPLFGPAVRSQNVIERTELKHVTPYDERFGVKIGPLRTVEF